jgi:hypothetical protein
MQPIGFFSTDVAEAASAYDEHVAGKRRPPEGIEIAPAGPNQGIGENLRKVSALNRIDIPQLWRTLIRAPRSKKGGPIVSILAPRNQSPAGMAGELSSAGIAAQHIETTEGSIECEFAPGTPSASLVQFSVAAVTKLSKGMGASGEWQWTLRPRGRAPE